MAIDSTQDVVLEVLKAADPARAAAAVQRLNALGSASGAEASSFSDALAQTARPMAADIAGLANARSALANAADAASSKTAKAEVDFEAVLLNNFVSEMLPKESTATFGQGMAGDMWKSMLADQVSRQIAKSGALGIARRLFAAHPLDASEQLEHASRLDAVDPHNTAQMSANAVSLPAGSAPSNGSFLFSGQKRS
jgi:peptidoglycan hydrolase FlgJ